LISSAVIERAPVSMTRPTVKSSQHHRGIPRSLIQPQFVH
jgi:hypothetical protein